MDTIYENGEWTWRKPLEIIASLKKRFAYSAGSLGIEMEGGNINLLQQRSWVAQESIKEPTPSLSRFDDFLQSYENYRTEGGRPRTIISYKMWPTTMQDQAFQGLRCADETSFQSKGSIDDEALILGYWMYHHLNTVPVLTSWLDAVDKLEYNGKSQKSITQSLEASYVQVQWFDMLRSWLHLLLADEGLHTLDIYLATALLKKCGWFSSEEQKNRIATMRKLTDQNYEWAAAMVRAEIYKVEDGSRLISSESYTY